jgi:hypothetical protein
MTHIRLIRRVEEMQASTGADFPKTFACPPVSCFDPVEFVVGSESNHINVTWKESSEELSAIQNFRRASGRRPSKSRSSSNKKRFVRPPCSVTTLNFGNHTVRVHMMEHGAGAFFAADGIAVGSYTFDGGATFKVITAKADRNAGGEGQRKSKRSKLGKNRKITVATDNAMQHPTNPESPTLLSAPLAPAFSSCGGGGGSGYRGFGGSPNGLGSLNASPAFQPASMDLPSPLLSFSSNFLCGHGNAAGGAIPSFEEFLQDDSLVPMQDLLSQSTTAPGWRVASFHPQVVYARPGLREYSERYIDVSLVQTGMMGDAKHELPMPKGIRFGGVMVNIFRVENERYLFRPIGIPPGDYLVDGVPFSVCHPVAQGLARSNGAARDAKEFLL